MIIRPANLADLPALTQIDAACRDQPWSAAQLSASLNPPSQMVVAECDGAIAGFLAWQTILDEAEIHLIDTAPARQRQGVASALLRYLCQQGTAAGWQRLLLEVRADNRPALALYQGFGFQMNGRRRAYYPSRDGLRVDALLMEYLWPNT